MRLAVIPARGGSKRIPKKNIKNFCGRPIIAWSIEAALQSNCFDRIIVSTDDIEIAKVAESFGAEVPFIRPTELSDDYCGTQPVISHAIKWHNKSYGEVDLACCIYPTAPFVQVNDLKRGLELIRDPSCIYSVPVTNFSYPIQRALRILGDERIQIFDRKSFFNRSQDLEQTWHDAGQFYWGRSSAWLSNEPIFGNGTLAIRLPSFRVHDIDDLHDWRRAELMFEALNAT